MDENFLKQLEYWHQEGEYDKIIEAIESLSALNMNNDLIGQLARAYNNAQNYERAIELLLPIKEQEEENHLWHFRLGYAYYYLDREAEAAKEFERVLELNPTDEDAKEFLDSCHEIMANYNNDIEIEMYDETEMRLVESHIEKFFGKFESVLHEIMSPDIHVDLCLINPNPERDYYTIVTMGMGAHIMNVPEELAEHKLQRAELVICLPKDWDINSDDEIWYWPLRCLKSLARLPINADTWLAWGHTIDNQQPYAANTELCGSMLLSTWNFGDGSSICNLPNGDEINFYQVIPLYREEMEYKINNDAETLLELMEGDILLINPARENFCKKKFTLLS